jgi:hypothetical protein
MLGAIYQEIEDGARPRNQERHRGGRLGYVALSRPADGIAATIVDGTLAFENGETAGDFATQVLKSRPAAAS